MSLKITHWLALIAGALVGGFVGLALLQALIGLVAFAAGAAGGVFLVGVALFGFQRTKQKAQEVASTAKAAAASAARKYDPSTETRKALNALAALNTDLRLSHGVAPAVLAGVESLVDKLAPLIERLYANFPSDQTTWNIAAIATNHLPALVRRYLAVETNTRAQAETDILSALAALASEVDSLVELIESNHLDEARAKAESIKNRFGNAI